MLLFKSRMRMAEVPDWQMLAKDLESRTGLSWTITERAPSNKSPWHSCTLRFARFKWEIGVARRHNSNVILVSMMRCELSCGECHVVRRNGVLQRLVEEGGARAVLRDGRQGLRWVERSGTSGTFVAEGVGLRGVSVADGSGVGVRGASGDDDSVLHGREYADALRYGREPGQGGMVLRQFGPHSASGKAKGSERLGIVRHAWECVRVGMGLAGRVWRWATM